MYVQKKIITYYVRACIMFQGIIPHILLHFLITRGFFKDINKDELNSLQLKLSMSISHRNKSVMYIAVIKPKLEIFPYTL